MLLMMTGCATLEMPPALRHLTPLLAIVGMNSHVAQ